MPSRKQATHPAGGDSGDDALSTLHHIRNMWQFANLCQWIYTFGKAAKIDDAIDIEEIETDCLKPEPMLLSHLALALLKLVSSQRGLTPDLLDDQLRKQYMSKAPAQNPFGGETEPVAFASLDVFTKIKVLQKLTQWTMIHAERLRERIPEQKDVDQTNWRIEPYGWDRHDRVYYVLDDNRIYRFTEPPRITPRSKPKETSWCRTGHRSRKRRRLASSEHDDDEDSGNRQQHSLLPEDDLGGATWECVAIKLQEVQAFMETLANSRDANEKFLRKQIATHLLPILEQQEEASKRKELQRERELLNLAKMANAKRSSRIADKAEKQKKEVEAREEERQKEEAERAEHRERIKRLKLEQERDSRMFSRQRRLNEREARRLRHEEELAQLSEDSKKVPEAARMSERHLQAEIQRNQQALKDIEQEGDEWIFDCTCGLYGQVDDGTHSVACETCNVWQHSRCLGISENEADQPEFHFVCSSCRHRAEEKNKSPRTIIKIKVRPSSTSAIAATEVEASTAEATKHDPITSSREDRPQAECPPKTTQIESQHTKTDTLSNQAASAATPIPMLAGHCDSLQRHTLSSASSTAETHVNRSDEQFHNVSGSEAQSANQSLLMSSLPIAKHVTAGQAQCEESARPNSPNSFCLNTRATDGVALRQASSEREPSTITLKHNRHSTSTEQSPSIFTFAPHTKDNS